MPTKRLGGNFKGQPPKKVLSPRKKKTSRGWFVYMVRCADGTLYTGITTDVERRVAEHNGPKAAKYTRTRQPVALVLQRSVITRSAALTQEAALKKVSRSGKLELLKQSVL